MKRQEREREKEREKERERKRDDRSLQAHKQWTSAISAPTSELYFEDALQNQNMFL
jgi:hypothetical protein